MQLILEHEDIERLLRQALKERGFSLGQESTVMKVRQNHKKSTIRIVFTTLMKEERNG
jgi:ribosomal protein L30E